MNRKFAASYHLPLRGNKTLTSVLIILFAIQVTYAQIPKGTWRDHLNFSEAKMVAISDQRVYCATQLALFYYELDDNSLHKLTPINKLSEIGIGSIAYHDSLDKLIVGYKSGNIDIFYPNGSKRNFPDLKQKSIVADKTIYHIDIYGKIAYLSTGFGLISFDLDREEFSDTYILGEDNTYKKINGAIEYKGFLYALTENGIMKGDLTNPFLSDAKNWSYVTEVANPSNNFNTGTVFNGYLLVNNTFANSDSCNTSSFDGETWQLRWTQLDKIKSLTTANNLLVLVEKWNIRVYSTFDKNDAITGDANAMHGLVDKNKNLWFASNGNGLVKYANGQKVTYYPDGPKTKNLFNVQYNSGAMLIAPGGVTLTGDATYKQADVYSFYDEEWSSLDLNNLPEIQPLRNVINFATTSKKDHYYAACWSHGIIEVNGTTVKNYNTENTDSVISSKIGGCTLDTEGNLWMTCASQNEPLAVKTANRNWYSYNYNGALSMVQIGRIFYTSLGQLWLVSPRGAGILIVDPNNTPEIRSDDKYKFFENIKNEEGLSQNTEINIMAEDHDGAIWLGTNEGIQVYDYPDEIFSSKVKVFTARRPLLVVDGYYQELLSKEIITGIVVDGGNRKWISTDGGGLYLVSPDGTEQLAVYNTDNSRLFSNNIISIDMNKQTGELFIATDAGLQSFMTTSTEGQNSYSSIYAFPNPVRPDFDGLITIRGLMEESVVKITDIAGNLVYETMSMGGDAVWNGKTLTGEEIVGGTYLVFCATKDGSSSGITKIQVIK